MLFRSPRGKAGSAAGTGGGTGGGAADSGPQRTARQRSANAQEGLAATVWPHKKKKRHFLFRDGRKEVKIGIEDEEDKDVVGT